MKQIQDKKSTYHQKKRQQIIDDLKLFLDINQVNK